jgi:hypothetical protein
MFVTYAFWLSLYALRRTYRQDYNTLFHIVILSKHHHQGYGNAEGLSSSTPTPKSVKIEIYAISVIIYTAAEIKNRQINKNENFSMEEESVADEYIDDSAHIKTLIVKVKLFFITI